MGPRLAQLPKGSRVPAVEAFLGNPEGNYRGDRRAAIRAKVDALLAGTKVTDLAERKKVFGESEAQLRARRDPLLELAFALDAELRSLKEREDRFLGAVTVPGFRRAA